MKPIIFTKQFGKKSVIQPEIYSCDISYETSVQDLINLQKSIQSTIGYYLFQEINDCFAIVLSDDKNFANKLGAPISNDIYTNDLFPVDYSEIKIKNLVNNNKDDITCIQTQGNNYFYLVPKGQDSLDTLKFIEMYKKRSYSMQAVWENKRANKTI